MGEKTKGGPRGKPLFQEKKKYPLVGGFYLIQEKEAHSSLIRREGEKEKNQGLHELGKRRPLLLLNPGKKRGGR